MSKPTFADIAIQRDPCYDEDGHQESCSGVLFLSGVLLDFPRLLVLLASHDEPIPLRPDNL